MTKPTKWHVRPAKTQISLGICPVWSESLLSAWRKLGSLATHWAHSEDSDQTGRMPRLIWVFAGRTVILLVLSWGGWNHGSHYDYNTINYELTKSYPPSPSVWPWDPGTVCCHWYQCVSCHLSVFAERYDSPPLLLCCSTAHLGHCLKITVKITKFETLEFIAAVVLKFEDCGFICDRMNGKQSPVYTLITLLLHEQSDLGLHCSVRKLRVIMGR